LRVAWYIGRVSASPEPAAAPLNDRLTPSRRWLILAGLAGGYLLIFFASYSAAGFGVSLLVVLPAAAAGWFFGRKIGWLASLTGMAANLALYGICAPQRWGMVVLDFGVPVALVCIIVAAVIGATTDQSRQAQWDLAELRRIALAEQEQRMLAMDLRDTAQALTAALSLDEALNRILANVGRMVPHESACLFLVTPAGRVSRVLAGQEHISPAERDFNYQLAGADLNHPFLQSLVATRDVLLIADAGDWALTHQAPWIRSYLCAPVFVNGQLTGLIQLTSATPRFFTELHVDRLRIFADQAAIAIQNANRYEETRQHASLLARANAIMTALNHVVARLYQPEPDAVLQTLVMELQSLGISSMVAMLDEEKRAFVARYSTFRIQAARGGARLPALNLEFRQENFRYFGDILAQRSVFAADTLGLLVPLLAALPARPAEEVSAAIAITAQTHSIFSPLVLEGRVAGMLGLWSDQLEEMDLSTAEVFASQVTLALHNASLYADIQREAITDYLTGLYNRRGLVELGQREVERALRFDRPLAAVMVDVDFFKEFNDQHSYQVGDQVLQEVARRMRRTIRDVDIAGRYGGEEFVLLIVENTRASALLVAERLRSNIGDVPFETDAGLLPVTVSLGLVSLTPNMADIGQLISAAGEALHLAKSGGRNRVEVI
jgi:diguanylate cyclase (GGDEF)-like protein